MDTKFKKGADARRQVGRKPGVPNKITGKVREALAPVIENYISGYGIGQKKESLEKDLAAMDPEARAKIITALVPYVVPKLASVEVKAQENIQSFRDELDELAREAQ